MGEVLSGESITGRLRIGSKKEVDSLIVKPAREIIKEFKEAYDRNQKGWHFLYGYDSKRRLNIYIGNKNEDSVWTILTEPHWGIGARIDEINIERFLREKEMEFGLRQVPDNLARRVLIELFEYHTVSQKTIEMIKKYPPQNREDVKKNWLEGPFVFVPHIETIDERIASELQEEFKKKLRERVRYIG